MISDNVFPLRNLYVSRIVQITGRQPGLILEGSHTMAQTKAHTATIPAGHVPSSEETRLLTEGWFAARDGRPHEPANGRHWMEGWMLWHSAHSPFNTSRELH